MRSGHRAQRGTEKSDGDSPTFPDQTRRENASESLSDMSTLLNNFREKTSRAGLVRSSPRRSISAPPLLSCPWVCARVFATPSPARVSSPARTRRNRAVRYRDPERRPSIHVPRNLPHLARSDASSPPPLPQSGWCHQVGSHLQRTSQYKPRDISDVTGGTMTTRTGEPATKRESYTEYIQGRAAKVI